MPSSLQSVVFADQIDIRFPFSGFVLQVHKKTGDSVTKGQTLAQLDTKMIQTELDKELSDYEKIRARFEIFNREHPNITDDTTRFLKSISQADLNASVKSVELVKSRLDQTRLISPIRGVLISDGGCRSGMFVTPASNSFTILDLDSLRLQTELDEVFDISQYNYSVQISNQSYSLTPSPIMPLGKKLIVDFTFSEIPNLQIGSVYTLNITPLP